MKRILVVDDEITVCNTVRAYLEADGYEVKIALDGAAALEVAEQFQPDLVVLDVMLPELDGIEVLRRIRQNDEYICVLMLTARGDEMDKVLGLKMGADDYLTKPFSPRELAARVQAILRRNHPSKIDTPPLMKFGTLSIDPAAKLVRKGVDSLDLTPTEYDLLLVLARHQGRVLSRGQLIEAAWGHDYFGDERVIDTHIKRLRHKVEDDPTAPRFITTVRGTGYRFDREPAL